MKAAEVSYIGYKESVSVATELNVLDGVMQSRYDMIHAKGGLLDVRVIELNAMAEVRRFIVLNSRKTR